jgi:hypothetical protein
MCKQINSMLISANSLLSFHLLIIQLPTGATGPHSFFHHHLFGRKMLTTDIKDTLSSMHKDNLEKIKKHLPTGAGKIHSESLDMDTETLFHDKLDKLKKLLPTGAWKWDAEKHDVEGQFFLPNHKIETLKKLLPTGHWNYDSTHGALALADDKTFFLHDHKFGKLIPTGALTGPWWKH